MFDLEMRNELRSIASEQLCRSIIRLATHHSHFSLKTIQMNPIMLRTKDWEYLQFWFRSGDGHCETQNTAVRRDLVLTDLCCTQ